MALDFSRIKALCFDVDGTLRDTDDQMVARLQRWFHWVSFLVPRGDAHAAARWVVMALENPGTYLLGLSDRLHLDHHIANLFDNLSDFRPGKENNPLPPIIPGVKEMLECFKDHFPMAVVSARGRRSTAHFLEYHNLNQFFNTIATGQTSLHTKPFPDPILWAARQMGLSPSSCLMIGDTTVDILAGKAAGAQTVGVLCGFGEEEELIYAGADLILSNTTDLLEILRMGGLI